MHNQTSQTKIAQIPLYQHVEQAVRQYFEELEDEIPSDLYELFLHQVEKPLLSVVLEMTNGNQSQCAKILGLNRGTLRKKIKLHELL